ncbi:MAG: hypothetical protein ACR2OJ_01965 [Hyphomicrobiales bacterium]
MMGPKFMLALVLLIGAAGSADAGSNKNAIKRMCWTKTLIALKCNLNDDFSEDSATCKNRARILFQRCLAENGLTRPQRQTYLQQQDTPVTD